MGIIPQKFQPERPQFSKLKGPLETYFINATAAVGSSATTAGFIDYPGPIDKIFIKRETATSLFVSGLVGAFKSVNPGNIIVGLLINGVDYQIGRLFYNENSVHDHITFDTAIASGLVAGTYTARVRWRCDASSMQADTGDPVQIRIEEGYAG